MREVSPEEVIFHIIKNIIERKLYMSEQGNKFIVITVLSTFPYIKEGENPIEFTYENPDGFGIKGIWTNEAGLKYFKQKYGETITDIITLCSEQTAGDTYQKRVGEIIGIAPHSVMYDYEAKGDEIISRLLESSELSFNSGDTVVVDASGGARSASFALMSLFRYLEYKGVRLGQVIYSNITDRNEKKGRIYDITETLDMFSLINGVYEFNTSGNPTALSQFVKKIPDSEIKTKITELLEQMKKFYNEISLCRPREIDTTLRNLSKKLNELIKLKERVRLRELMRPKGQGSSSSGRETLFFELLPLITEKFHTGKEGITMLGLIKWCVDNGLIQQAITFYVEKLPKEFTEDLYFFEPKSEDSKTIYRKKASKLNPDDIYYRYFFSQPDIKARMNKLFTEKESDIILSIRSGKALAEYKKHIEEYDNDEEFGSRIYDALWFIARVRANFYSDHPSTDPEKKAPVPEEKQSADYRLLYNQLKKCGSISETFKSFYKNFSKNDFKIPGSDTAEEKEHGATLTKMLPVILSDKFDTKKIELNIDTDDLKVLRLHFACLKYIRNNINHASTQEPNDKEIKVRTLKLLSELSGNDDFKELLPEKNNFNAELIGKFIAYSVDHINDVISKMSEK